MWARIWKATAQPGPDLAYLQGPLPELPRFGGEEVLAAARAFKPRAATAPDGVHVRRFALLPKVGRQLCAQLMQLCERVGLWPTQISQLLVVLLPKVPGPGWRPIGILPSFYRLWMKIRRGLCSQWEHQHDRAFFAMGAHRKVTDPVWRQAVRAEASICTGQASCTILWDLVKRYETIHFKHLWQEGATLDFPHASPQAQLAGLPDAKICLHGR